MDGQADSPSSSSSSCFSLSDIPYPYNSLGPNGEVPPCPALLSPVLIYPESPAWEDEVPKLTREHAATPEDPYRFLKHFDTVILIDDSAEMERYWGQVGTLLEKIAPICTERDRNGIDIYFVNHHPRGYHIYGLIGRETDRAGYRHIGQVTGTPEMRDNVTGIFQSVKPGGKCRLGHRLAQILDKYMRDYHWCVRGKGMRGDAVVPLNIIVITAGVTDDNPNDTLIRTARQLDELDAPEYQVGIQFFRVGHDESARQAMKFADESLAQAMDFRDMVDTVTWSGKEGELSPDAVLKVVLGAVERSIDKELEEVIRN
ncbi:hypothetical protein GGR54DRAFT_346979 [Hypoxylon sp. NC1633]|nr:hypothetical protein GGR54DRAFT_346979 [Hypoxylon sp. NC1633]